MPVPISNVTRRAVYAPSGGGGAGPYAFTFEILAATDIAVYKDDVLLTLTTHYTVTINANGTGSVTITATGLALPPASPTQYAIVGNRTISRTTDFTTGGDFFANVLNDELDQQTIFAQQNAEGLQRALAAPQTDPTSINMTLPRASLRANKALGFDANGNPVISDTLGTNRGNWAAGTLYYVRDIVKDTTNNNIWQVITQHTSSGSQPINTNADSAKWTLLVDAASATTSATNAAASASAASTSASNASTSASNAATSASNAATSASSAATSATNAATSATNAFIYANNSATYANGAATSAANASNSAAEAATTYDAFDDRYLGSKASDPSVDNDGAALLDGALYWDTTNNILKVYDQGATTWRRTTPTTSDQANINTVSGIAANVTTVATNSANVTTVSGSIASVNTNATNIANINQNAANITAIQNASSNATAAAASATTATTQATNAAASAAAASAVVLGNEPVRPSVRPSLLLDFANTKQLDPRITFTRASTATFYDGQTVAKAEENLLLRSQEFDNVAWNDKTNVTVTANATTAPDGTTTAEQIDFLGTTEGVIAQTIAAPVVGQTYVFSVWLRADSNQTVTLRFRSTVTQSASVTTAWQRFTFTRTVAAANETFIGIGGSDTTAKTIYAWGAQLEQRSTVTAYTATTTQPITNYIPALQTAAAGVPRFEHNPTTGESLGLEIEEQRTNLLTYSEQFDNAAWTKGANVTVTTNTVVAPDGALTADLVVSSANTDSSANQVFQQATVASSQTYTASFWVRAAGANQNITIRQTANGVLVTNTTVAVTSTWQRVSATFTASTNPGFAIRPDGVSNLNIYVWGAQLEAGAFATSYIQTVASQVTRSADAASMTGTNFSSWYRADEGTIYSEFNRVFADTNNSGQFVMLSDGSATNRMYMQYTANTNFGAFEVIVGGTTQAAINSAAMTIGSYHKMGAAYKVNDIASSVDGATVGTDTSATIPVVNQMSIGNRGYTSAGFLNGTIKKIAYYPLRLTNAQLQGITTV